MKSAVTCDLCGRVVRKNGLGSHQRGKVCEAYAFARRMYSKGWTEAPTDMRGFGVPGEHGPIVSSVMATMTGNKIITSNGGNRRPTLIRYGVWHPEWVSEAIGIMREVYSGDLPSSSGRHARVWRKLRDDAEWREALLSAYALGGADAAHSMLSAVEKADMLEGLDRAISSIAKLRVNPFKQ